MKLTIVLSAAMLICISSANSYFAALAEPFHYAQRWSLWGDVARDAYIDGAIDGIAEAFVVTMVNVAPDKIRAAPTPEVMKATDRLFVRSTRNLLRDVITDLYRDPANAFISTKDMLFLARDKIEGKDISKDIVEARRSALKAHELNERMKEGHNN